MAKKKILISIIVLLSFVSCQKNTYNYYYICNNSSGDIYLCDYRLTVNIDIEPKNIIAYSWDNFNCIKSHSKKLINYYDSDSEWSYLYIYMYKEETVHSHSFSEIKEQNYADRIYIIPRTELEKEGGLVVLYDDDDTTKW